MVMRGREKSSENPQPVEYLLFLTKAPTEHANAEVLNVDHRASLERALMRILQTSIAEETFAEVLYGMPLTSTYRSFYQSGRAHPSINNTELCPDALREAREFRAGFDSMTLQFPLFVLSAFQGARIGSKQFHVRLLELLAISCHQIAVYLFEHTRRQGRNPRHVEHEEWRQASPTDVPYDSHRPILAFSHRTYTAYEQYPCGLGDVVGYWAEAKIFGGIIVFDRGDTETECRELYMHSCRVDSPRTLYALTPEQFDQLIQSLLRDDPKVDERVGLSRGNAIPPCPLPIVATLENRYRWDPWDAFARFYIFRDRHERRIRTIKHESRRDHWTFDWPEYQDEMLIVLLENERRQGDHIDQARLERLEISIKRVTPSSPLWARISRRAENGFLPAEPLPHPGSRTAKEK